MNKDFIYEDEKIYMTKDGKVVSEIDFPIHEGVAIITHTFVDDSLRGKGIASKLVEEAYNSIKERNLLIRPLCSYAKKWFNDNPDYQDILVKR